MQWVQGPNQRTTSRHFRKIKAYLKAKIEEYETNSKIKILGIYIGASVPLRRVTSLEVI